MVKIKTSALVSELHGKLNGSYFRDSQNGLILSKKQYKTDQPSFLQEQIRMRHYNLETTWKNLTEFQRRSWLNNSYNGMKGYRLFFYCNWINSYAGYPVITSYYPYQKLNITGFYVQLYYSSLIYFFLLSNYYNFPAYAMQYLLYVQNPFLPQNKNNKFVLIGVSSAWDANRNVVSNKNFLSQFGKMPPKNTTYPCIVFAYDIRCGIKQFVAKTTYTILD